MAKKSDGPSFDADNPNSPVNALAREEALRSRGEYRRDVLELVCDAAESYRQEMQRMDGAHAGRLAQRRQELVATIREAFEAFKEEPLTIQDIEKARRRLAKKDLSGSR